MVALSVIGFLGFIGCLVWLIVLAVKKQKIRNSLIGMGVAAVLFIVGVANSSTSQTVPTSADSGTPASAVSSEAVSSVAPSSVASSTPVSSAPASSEKSVEEIRKSAKSISYKELARYPDKYKDQIIKFSGKVVQSIDESGSFTLRVAQNDNSDQMFLVAYLPTNDARILENDEVTVYGSYDGVQSYTSTLGAQITIPSVSTADIVIK